MNLNLGEDEGSNRFSVKIYHICLLKIGCDLFWHFHLQGKCTKSGSSQFKADILFRFLENGPGGPLLQTELPEVSTASESEDYPPFLEEKKGARSSLQSLVLAKKKKSFT